MTLKQNGIQLMLQNDHILLIVITEWSNCEGNIHYLRVLFMVSWLKLRITWASLAKNKFIYIDMYMYREPRFSADMSGSFLPVVGKSGLGSFVPTALP